MSGMEPIILFDKSTLQSLSVDESVWFDALYYASMTPVFFVETLADLEKEIAQGRTPEQVVGNLAEKTPTGGHINVYHATLCVHELLGQTTVEMRRVPIIAGGRPVRVGERRGTVYEEPPERQALHRWEERRFLDVERDFARGWRQSLSGLNLATLKADGRAIIEREGRPRDLAEALAIARRVLERPQSRYTAGILESFRVPGNVQRRMIERWRERGGPPIRDYAPYTAHVAIVDTLFCIGLGADLISADRPSNKIDIAYLYYLPFCMCFTSNDGLHARTAPLFLGDGQHFVPGHELKADLAKLDAHYSALPDEVKERGVMSFAHYPPTEGDFLVSTLWDKLMVREWRERAKQPEEPRSAERDRQLIQMIEAMGDAPRDDSAARDAEKHDAVMFQRMVPVRRGKWRLVPPEAEEAERRARDSKKGGTTPS